MHTAKVARWWYLLPVLAAVGMCGGGVLPPPWADPKQNPCAAKPRGWQLIYWPPDKHCYKIFTIGYPCPETMELAVANDKRAIRAECKCPPKTALNAQDGKCYELFKNKPCKFGQYFGPAPIENSRLRYGTCLSQPTCPSNSLFYPPDSKCYDHYTQGPCSKGQLLTLDPNGVAICHCSDSPDMRQHYWSPKQGCYEHYTRGPCQEEGHLFVPDGKCECHQGMVQFHNETKQCYELGTLGPCEQGHHFAHLPNTTHAICQCKPEHILWSETGKCYRPFTRGPCELGQMLYNSSYCGPLPCARGHLYFPHQSTCYRVGTQGPCSLGQVVTFDFRTRPSIDGISYNGICACTGTYNPTTDCLKEKRSTKSCEAGQASYDNQCYKLYTRGPCNQGQWLVPHRQDKQPDTTNTARCDCKPGYARTLQDNELQCLPPAVSLANYLNKNFVNVGSS